MFRLPEISCGSIVGSGLAPSLLIPVGAAQAGDAESLLCSFTGSTGSDPVAGVSDDKGNFYGTTVSGGGNGYATVFKVTPAESVPPVLRD